MPGYRKYRAFGLKKPVGLTLSHTLFANSTLQFPAEHLLQEDGAEGDRSITVKYLRRLPQCA